MSDETIEIFDASEAQSDDDWLSIMDEIGEESGYFEALGKDHHAHFSDLGKILLVSFESMGAIRRAGGGQMPLGYQVAAPRGWSSLTVIAKSESWFRDRSVFGYFDRLIDDGFFEDFDRVVFYGAGMGGYAAAAFSVAAPGSTVLALSPQSTLDSRDAEWDRRFPAARRLDFTERYGFAPDMVEGCARVFIVYDPVNQIDAVHAAMFRGSHVEKLRARHIGRDPQSELAQIGILRTLIDSACVGHLDRARFYRLWRKRRTSDNVLGRILGRVQSANNPPRFLSALRAVCAISKHPQFAKALARAESKAASAEGKASDD